MVQKILQNYFLNVKKQDRLTVTVPGNRNNEIADGTLNLIVVDQMYYIITIFIIRFITSLCETQLCSYRKTQHHDTNIPVGFDNLR